MPYGVDDSKRRANALDSSTLTRKRFAPASHQEIEERFTLANGTDIGSTLTKHKAGSEMKTKQSKRPPEKSKSF